MPRDYKNIKKQAKTSEKKSGAWSSNFLSFLTGLSIGLFIAAYYYLDLNIPWNKSGQASGENVEVAEKEPGPEKPGKDNSGLPIPDFEFYDILKKRKLNISERIATEQENRTSTDDTDNTYILQVSASKEYRGAEQLRAELALIGIEANIQRVVINADTWHQVRVGPFETPEQLNKTRRRLEENNHQYMLIKLEVEKDAG